MRVYLLYTFICVQTLAGCSSYKSHVAELPHNLTNEFEHSINIYDLLPSSSMDLYIAKIQLYNGKLLIKYGQRGGGVSNNHLYLLVVEVESQKVLQHLRLDFYAESSDNFYSNLTMNDSTIFVTAPQSPEVYFSIDLATSEIRKHEVNIKNRFVPFNVICNNNILCLNNDMYGFNIIRLSDDSCVSYANTPGSYSAGGLSITSIPFVDDRNLYSGHVPINDGQTVIYEIDSSLNVNWTYSYSNYVGAVGDIYRTHSGYLVCRENSCGYFSIDSGDQKWMIQLEGKRLTQFIINDTLLVMEKSGDSVLVNLYTMVDGVLFRSFGFSAPFYDIAWAYWGNNKLFVDYKRNILVFDTEIGKLANKFNFNEDDSRKFGITTLCDQRTGSYMMYDSQWSVFW